MNNKTMDVHIWNDLWQTCWTAKVFALCCSVYANSMRRRNKVVDIAIIILPALGSCAFYFSAYITLVGSILTSICALLVKVLPQIIQSDAELCKLDDLQTKFNLIITNCFDCAQDFRLKEDFSDIDVKEFIKAKKLEIDDLSTQVDKLVRKAPDSDKLNKEAEIYMNQKFILTE